MERYVFLGVLLFTIVALGVGMMIPGKETSEADLYMPWQIERSVEGKTRVFGLELGVSTLTEAQRRFHELYEVSMFVREDGVKVVEAFFDSVTLSGLRARVVVVLDLTPEQLDGLYDRGVRISKLESGGRKVMVNDADLPGLASTPIASLTYIPRSHLKADMVETRFGRPSERIRETGGDEVVEHWLYPHYGLDLALHEKGKEVLQYVQTDRFELLRKPLLEAGERVK